MSAGRNPYAQNPDQVPPSTTFLLPKSQEGPQPSFRGPSPSLRSSTSNLSLNETPYAAAAGSRSNSASVVPSLSDKFSLSPDPSSWGADLSPSIVEPDDYLHNPDPRRDRNFDKGGTVITSRGLANLGCLLILGTGLVALFAGYPIVSYFTTSPLSTLGGFNLGGTNATGQVAKIPGSFGLIDVDTPQSAYTKPSYVESGVQMELVFSDEFNTDGRSFYPGDDPYWEAVDLYYWQTADLEWYDPEAVTTNGGYLTLTLSEKQTHNLSYQSGMMSTWNKFCFTGGILETSVILPGASNVIGLWPAVWSVGNLGRVGYGASLEGLWPYTYDSCDVGTVANQTKDNLPLAATENGDPKYGNVLSYLPGQRLSRCTCAGESHPGPMHSDGTFVGRSAPEIDVLEGQITTEVTGVLGGQLSQSAQWAPMNAEYIWANTTVDPQNLYIPNPETTILNPYMGGAYQQVTSGVTEADQTAYELSGNNSAIYAYEYKPGFDDAYIAWVTGDQLVWQLNSAGLGADNAAEISARPVSQEPMYIVMNLGLSYSFASTLNLADITFPATMRIDYIRVYQNPNSKNIGCDPPDFPTASYINQYIDAYTNPNLTTWDGPLESGGYNQAVPKNSFLGQC